MGKNPQTSLTGIGFYVAYLRSTIRLRLLATTLSKQKMADSIHFYSAPYITANCLGMFKPKIDILITILSTASSLT